MKIVFVDVLLNSKAIYMVSIRHFVVSRINRVCILFLLSLTFFSNVSFAQDSIKRSERFRFVDSALLSDSNILTNSDYLSALERVLEAQNKVPAITGSFSNLDAIGSHLANDDSAIMLIKERLSNVNDRTLNLQNLQTYGRLLEELNENIKDYNKDLTKYDIQLDDLKKELFILRKDTLVKHIFVNTELRHSFMQQLLELRSKWKVTDSLISSNTAAINKLKAKASSNSFAIAELSFKTDELLKKATVHAFAKERRYLWEPANIVVSNANKVGFQKKVEIEKKIAAYYFQNTRNNRTLLLWTGLIFFFWIVYNFKSLKRLNKLEAINKFSFQYIGTYPVFASLIFILSVAPLFDMDAPQIYTEIIQLLTLITLTVYFVKRLPRSLFYMWCGYFLLFLSLPFFRLLGLPVSLERWWMLIINSTSVLYGIVVLFIAWKNTHRFKHLLGIGILYIILNILAIVCNLFGRVTLAQSFHSTAVYGFAQAVSLTILVQIMIETFLLQILSSRIRKNYPERFDSVIVTKGILKIASILAITLWLIAFADNLNVFDMIVDWLVSILSTEHTIGSFSFTMGGIIMFLGIIWVANFLQKYIAYFFGDMGDDILLENKGERSRLLITRLILLIAGFFLAVAASGLPLDKITIILGALSVGIGLGLQNIVNNFVSGIILIFDRTLRIGDIVEVSDKRGRVKEIGIRTSTLLTDDGAEIIIPNGDVVSHNIINWTLTNSQVRININLTIQKPYNIDEVSAICRKEVADNKNVVVEKEPEIVITAITPVSATVKLYFWCKSITRTEITYSEVYAAIYNTLETEGVKVL